MHPFLSEYPLYLQFYAHRNSISCIVCFAKDGSPFRAQSLKILSSLCKSNGQELLCSSDTDAVSVACQLLTRTLEQSLTDSEERHCVTIICMLAHDSCNRAKIRTSGAFKRILDLAKNTSSDSLLSMVSSFSHSFQAPTPPFSFFQFINNNKIIPFLSN